MDRLSRFAKMPAPWARPRGGWGRTFRPGHRVGGTLSRSGQCTIWGRTCSRNTIVASLVDYVAHVKLIVGRANDRPSTCSDARYIANRFARPRQPATGVAHNRFLRILPATFTRKRYRFVTAFVPVRACTSAAPQHVRWVFAVSLEQSIRCLSMRINLENCWITRNISDV